MSLRVAHVVRRFGGVTEPFIATRIESDPDRELWCERMDVTPHGVTVQTVDLAWLRPGTFGDRLFHRLPWIGPPLAGPYGRLERRRAPDVLHAHYLTTGWLVGSRTRTPLVLSAYGFDATVLARRDAWRRAYRRLAARAAAVVVEGPHMAGTVAALGFDPARIHVVPIAAALEEVEYRAPDSRSTTGRPVRLISCGRLVPKKGHDLAIRALAGAGLAADATLTIVGDGPMRADLAALASDLAVSSRVRFAGALSRAAWLRELGQHDILVAASVTAPNGDQEGGAPTTILDAQAAGVPVVGSRHCDIPYLVDDGVTGYLAPEGSAPGLSEVLRRALDGRASWPMIATTAREQVVRRHTDDSAARLIRAIHAMVAA